jgi:hypothetical protein
MPAGHHRRQAGKREPDDSPLTQATRAAWASMSLKEREAYHRVMCQNSRDFMDCMIVKGMTRKIRKAATALEK